MSVVDLIFALFAERGDTAYFGEAVSQREHALQAARLAEQAGAPDGLVIAALLHDIGHLLHALPEDVAERAIDARHEDVGARWLAAHFRPEVAGPARLHVAAKRYLCAVDPAYARQLSAASQQSLALQGGPFSAADARKFIQQSYAAEAVALRRWDDAAKIPGLLVPGLEHYRCRLEGTLARSYGVAE